MASACSWRKLVIVQIVCAIFIASISTATDALDHESNVSINAFFNLTYYIQGAKRVHTEKSEVGKFGTGKIGSAYGTVVHVRSRSRSGNDSSVHDGCEYPFGNSIPNDTSWIALIKRGNCTFEKKLENAWKSKASAMVVYDSESKDDLEQMDLKPNIYTIPGIFTYKWKGEEIAHLVDNGTSVTMYITVGDARQPFNGINRTSVLFVSISFIVLMIISLAWLVFYYVQRFRYLHAKDRLAQRLCNAAKKALAKIPTRHIKVLETNGEGEMCAVCIEIYRSGDTLRTLPCKHEFHKLCVDPWLLEHRTCPMCKMDILRHFGFTFTGSQESILHLDIDENGMNSSESRETDSPAHHHHHHHHPHHHLHHHHVRHPQTMTTQVVVAAPRIPADTSVDIENGLVKDSRRSSSTGESSVACIHENEHPMSRVLPQLFDTNKVKKSSPSSPPHSEEDSDTKNSLCSKSSSFLKVEPDLPMNNSLRIAPSMPTEENKDVEEINTLDHVHSLKSTPVVDDALVLHEKQVED